MDPRFVKRGDLHEVTLAASGENLFDLVEKLLETLSIVEVSVPVGTIEECPPFGSQIFMARSVEPSSRSIVHDFLYCHPSGGAGQLVGVPNRKLAPQLFGVKEVEQLFA
jgi:hypothetical protein